MKSTEESRARSSDIAAIISSPNIKEGEDASKICIYTSDLKDLKEGTEYIANNGKMTPLKKKAPYKSSFDAIRIIKRTHSECQFEIIHYEWPLEEPTDIVGRITRI